MVNSTTLEETKIKQKTSKHRLSSNYRELQSQWDRMFTIFEANKTDVTLMHAAARMTVRMKKIRTAAQLYGFLVEKNRGARRSIGLKSVAVPKRRKDTTIESTG